MKTKLNNLKNALISSDWISSPARAKAQTLQAFNELEQDYSSCAIASFCSIVKNTIIKTESRSMRAIVLACINVALNQLKIEEATPA